MFYKVLFTICPHGREKKLFHMKSKSKESYLGEKYYIICKQITEQLAVEVSPKGQHYIHMHRRGPLFALCFDW